MSEIDEGSTGISPTPNNLEGLFKFYNETVKPFYSVLESENSLPVEILFELHATLNHVSRIYAYGEDEDRAVAKAYSHLKRACLDVFKIVLRETLLEYVKLCKIDTSAIDNGKFDTRMHKLIYEIKQEAAVARASEGDKRGDDEGKVLAFDLWQPVLGKCTDFRENYFNNENVAWAQSRQVDAQGKEAKARKKERILGMVTTFVLGVITSLVATWAWCTYIRPESPAPKVAPLVKPDKVVKPGNQGVGNGSNTPT